MCSYSITTKLLLSNWNVYVMFICSGHAIAFWPLIIRMLFYFIIIIIFLDLFSRTNTVREKKKTIGMNHTR